VRLVRGLVLGLVLGLVRAMTWAHTTTTNRSCPPCAARMAQGARPWAMGQGSYATDTASGAALPQFTNITGSGISTESGESGHSAQDGQVKVAGYLATRQIGKKMPAARDGAAS